MEGIEYYEDRKLDKSQMLRLSTCKYVDEGHHVIWEDASGNGKLISPALLEMQPAADLRKSHIFVCLNY